MPEFSWGFVLFESVLRDEFPVFQQKVARNGREFVVFRGKREMDGCFV